MFSGRFSDTLTKSRLVVLLWLLFAGFANAQLVELHLNLKKENILIGERTSINLTIIKHQNVFLQRFPLSDSLNKEIEILDSLTTQSQDSLKLSLDITSFTAGQYFIPLIPLVFKYENTTDTIFSPELLLTVISPEINNQADIRDIKPPLNLPFRLREIIPQTGIAIGILLVILLLTIYLVRRLRKKIILEKAERALPAHVFAFRQLDKLKEEKLWQKGQIKEYYSRLADIMRVYLEKRFNIPAMEFVSSETIQAFSKSMPQEDTLKDMLENILQTSDMVKFAKEDPLPAENQGNMDNAYLFIGQTRIEEVLTVEEKINETESSNDNEKISKE